MASACSSVLQHPRKHHFFNAQAIVCKVAYLTSHKQTSSNQLFSNQAKSNCQNVTSPACHRIAWKVTCTASRTWFLPCRSQGFCYHCRSTSADLLRVYNTLFKRWGHLKGSFCPCCHTKLWQKDSDMACSGEYGVFDIVKYVKMLKTKRTCLPRNVFFLLPFDFLRVRIVEVWLLCRPHIAKASYPKNYLPLPPEETQTANQKSHTLTSESICQWKHS